jgi:site-specific recombinase XerD
MNWHPVVRWKPWNFEIKSLEGNTLEGLKTTYQFFKKEGTKIDLSKYRDQIPDPETLIEQLTKEEIESLLDGITSDAKEPDYGNEHDDPFW